jgi:hypothetical protein
MKTIISLLDDLFAAVDALTEYVAKHIGSRVTEQLDAVYSAEPSKLDAQMRRAARRTLKRNNW